jgi:glycosyltransferase involved in cell wall biosynthesis
VEFAQAIEGADVSVELVRRVEDMRGFYDSLGALLVPSVYEGYGMVGVEAMLRGIPVVARDYPAIREAVGDGARIVRFEATSAEWVDAMADVLSDRSRWVSAAQARMAELAVRETVEIETLKTFLDEI